MSKTLLKNLNMIDPFGGIAYKNKVLIFIENGIIRSVQADNDNEYNEFQTIDMEGKYVLPGMINAHHHLYSSLALGMPSPSITPSNFVEKLEFVWWVLDRALDEESMRASFEVGLLECLKSGVTTVFDHHSSQSWITGSLDILADTAEKYGMNISPCFEMTDRNGKAVFNEALEENLRTIKKYKESPFVSPLLGLHASFTLEDDSLKRISKYIEKDSSLGIHIHLSEDKADEVDALLWDCKSAVTRLEKFKLLNKNGFVAHGLHINDYDLNILKKRGVTLVHNPTSNSNNRVGLLADDTINTLEAGLGTDGMQANMLKEAKEGTLIRSSHSNAGEETADYLELLFRNNPRIASKKFNRKIGHISKGFQADLVFYDYSPKTEINLDNYGGHILFGLEKPSDVMTRGKFRIRNNELVGLSEKDILENAKIQSRRLWTKMAKI